MMDTHYYMLKMPARYFNDEVKKVLLDCFGYTQSDDDMLSFLQYVTITEDIVEIEFDETTEHSGPVDAMNKINVPCVGMRGSSYEYDETYWFSYLAGHHSYVENQVVEVIVSKDYGPVIPVSLLEKTLTESLEDLKNTKDYKQLEDRVRQMKADVSSLNIFINNVEDNFLQYYAHETDIGRNASLSKKIDEVLRKLDDGELTSSEAMEQIKQIREGEEKDV